MAKKEPDIVALQRPERPQRKRPWWLLIPVVLVLIVAGGLLYVLQYRIADVFQGAPTLPPTPPGVGTPGVLYYTDFENLPSPPTGISSRMASSLLRSKTAS